MSYILISELKIAEEEGNVNEVRRIKFEMKYGYRPMVSFHVAAEINGILSVYLPLWAEYEIDKISDDIEIVGIWTDGSGDHKKGTTLYDPPYFLNRLISYSENISIAYDENVFNVAQRAAMAHFLENRHAKKPCTLENKKVINMTPNELKKWRTDHNLTQKTMADMLGVSASAIEKWQSGANPISKLVELALRSLSQDLKQGDRP